MSNAIMLEVVKGSLIYTAEEMGIALKKSAYSPNIKERMDHSCAIFDHKKRLIAQAEHIPVHLGSMALAVRMGLEKFGEPLNNGDMILLNDPYISGTHLPDLTVIAPVYFKKKHIGYVANKAHHTDVGGKTPGSISGDSTELYQEGIIIPPVKLLIKDKIDRDLAEILKANVRNPEILMGDLRAQIAANKTGVIRLRELVQEHGFNNVLASMGEILNYSERLMRAEIRNMPDGVYEASDWMEDTGTGDKPVEIRVKIVVDGGDIVFDYEGTAIQVEGPINAPLGVTISGIYFTLISVTNPFVPVNDGCFRPVTLDIPDGSILNPVKPAPVAGGNVETSQRNVDVLMRAFAKILPEKVPAAGLGTMNNISIGGLRKDGTLWTFYETIGGGSGGRPSSDGVDGIHVNMTNTMNTPIEAIEAYLPMMFESYNLRADSGGPGEWRGGCGIERSWVLVASKATLSIMAERTKIHPWGLKGGKPGALGEYLFKRKDGGVIKLRSKCIVSMEKGDKLIIRTPGGGGYGVPFKRSSENVLKDVLNGLVSVEAAEKEYGVIIDPKKMVIMKRH